MYTQPVPFELKEEASERSLTQCMLVPERKEIVTVSVEHNIVLYDAQTLELKKQVTTFNHHFPISLSMKALPWDVHASCLYLNGSLVTSQKPNFTDGAAWRKQEKRKQSRPEIPQVLQLAC